MPWKYYNFVIKYDELMSQLPTLIADLALILICAGIMTLLFKKLKQPLVLGYVGGKSSYAVYAFSNG